ncbi:MAG TPA: FAD-binding protein [Pseudonocardiaceae bacterium]|nr:FAD-binding protein [Pseudonocardiaceae bacterium]
MNDAVGTMSGEGSRTDSRPGPVAVDRADPRYADLVGRGINARFRADPETIQVVGATEHVVRVMEEVARQGKRVGIRSGGHCFEGLVDNPAVEVVLDISEMNAVYFDASRRAFAVEAGATLGAMYRTLFLGWGVTVPAGRCPGIGVGGHVVGGGGGALSRRYGLSVDHLYAVEVVVVDASGQVGSVVATREPDDPNRDLWWAHTGAGGGNFGVVTRYWFRSPDARPNTPESLLPSPPSAVLKKSARWQWADLNEEAFRRLVGNFGWWHEHNSAAGCPGVHLDNGLTLPRAAGGPITLETSVDAGRRDGDELTDEFIAAVNRDVGVLPEVEVATTPWLTLTLTPDEYAGVSGRFKSKVAFLRTSWADEQITGLYRHLTDSDYQNPAAAVYLLSHGGRINAVRPADTAMPHRDAVLKAYWSVFWFDSREDDVHLRWIRDSYREVFADAGGVPDPDAVYAGAFINYADADLVDPALNTSGVPWHRLYYRDSYSRLQQVKARWDPRNVFRHALSISAAGDSGS